MNAHPSRRHLLKIMSGVPLLPLSSAIAGSGLLLTGRGGNSTATINPNGKVTQVAFNGMPNPASDADRAGVFTHATIDITYESGHVARALPLNYKTIYRTGDVLKDPQGNDILAGGFFQLDGITPIIDNSGATAEQFYSDCVDGTSLLALPNPDVSGINGHAVFAVTQFEYKTSNNRGDSQYGCLPATIAVVTLDQSKTTGELTVKQYFNVPTEAIHGLWIPCAGSLSPWSTHLSSEEYEPDAWLVKLRRAASGAALSTTELPTYTVDQLKTVNGSLEYFEAFSTNAFGARTLANPYHYGHVPEVLVRPDGTASVIKHYNMGRISRELVQVMPDNRTVLMGDDYTNGGLFMFVADVAKVLSSGTLYAAKVTQTAPAQDAEGGSFTIEWIRLGHASSLEIEQLANNKPVDQIIDVRYTDPADANYKPVVLDGLPVQWVKVLDAQAAAFLETHRYANCVGASMEFTKFEGVTVNVRDKVAYIAMSRLEKSMSDAAAPTVSTDVDVKKVSAGAIYALTLSENQTERGSVTPINSQWVPTAMSVPSVTAPYVGKLMGEDKTIDTDGNTAVVDKIANPDNVKFSEAMRTLFIGEDSGQHLNNFVWAYNVDTHVLSRVLSVPAGAECTGLQAVDNLHGFAYVMSGFQHAADWTFGPRTVGAVNIVDQSAIKSAVLANYGPSAPYGSKTVAKRAAVGYIAGLPVIG